MEQYAYRALTYELFRRVLAEPEFRDWPDVGIVVQAYQPEAEAELRMLLRLGRVARHADHDPAGQGGVLGLRGPAAPGGWAGPSRSTWRSGRATRRSSVARGSCCEHHDRLRPAFGSHNVRSLAHAIAAAEAMGLPAVGLRAPDAPRHGRRRSRARWSTAATGCASTRRTAPCCRAWPTWCAGCWRTRRTSRSSS